DKGEDHFQKTSEMIAVDVRAGGFLQIVFFDIGENLLPAGEVLNQAIESFERSKRHEGKDEPLLRAAIAAEEQCQEEGSQIGNQQQEMRNRLVALHADGEIRRGRQFVARPSE